MAPTIELDDGDFSAYVATPAGPVRGGLVVIHEIWGLVDHITDVADRFAAEGYLAVAPDLLSHVGLAPAVGAELLRLRTSADPEEQTRVQPMLREKMAPLQAPEYATWAVQALRHTVDYVVAQPGVADRVGVVGFCFGGSYTFALAAADDRISAAVPFYGSPPELTGVAAIDCRVLAFYGDQDQRLMDSLPAVTKAMTAAGVDFTAKVYPGVGHAFFNDTNPQTYDAAAAADAWGRTLEALKASPRYGLGRSGLPPRGWLVISWWQDRSGSPPSTEGRVIVAAAPADIDEYLDTLSPQARDVVARLRGRIHEPIPGAGGDHQLPDPHLHPRRPTVRAPGRMEGARQPLSRPGRPRADR